MEAKFMTKLIDALSARTRFGELMEEAEKGKTRFLVSRRGKPKVVILGVRDYLKNVIKQPEILTTIQLSAQKAGLDKMSDKEIESEIADYRRSKSRK
ncbi:MAG: type II toxin-antitoxin system Phd/YefM family antitoxin [Thermodesulfobacteriota bacterium]|nr:type II toxin-antitoxin system Phd/YefM family antitoxin [Thermodesulfobacteriota bacterium]